MSLFLSYGETKTENIGWGEHVILVVGGAGYIGSHTVKELVRQGEKVVVLDNLSTGHANAVDKKAILVEGNLGDAEVLKNIFENYSIRAVMHFAANSLVSESVQNPLKYYRNNVAATLTLLEKVLEYGVRKFIFSSTAATYGIPEQIPIKEEAATKPINPYGHSKLMIEQILQDFASAYNLQSVILRYFNAAGADKSGEIGEDHNPETHLIPILLQHLAGQRDRIPVFGTDYLTKDGTCIRDYIHVTDLAQAHILALKSLLLNNYNTPMHTIYNLGNGKGYSVAEVIQTCEAVTGGKAVIEYLPRREGDPPILVASAEKIKRELGWKPSYSLEQMISTAWNWQRRQHIK